MLNFLRLCIGLSLLTIFAGCGIFSSSQQNLIDKSVIPEDGNIFVKEQIASSRSFQQKFAKQTQQVEEFKQRVLTNTTSSLNLAKPEGKLNNLVADMLRWHVSRVQGQETDVGYFPLPLLQDSIAAGVIRVEDVYRVIPNDRPVSVYRVNGMLLHQLFDSVAVRGGGAVSGVRMRINDNRAHDVLVGSQPIQHDRWYHLAAPSGLFCKDKGIFPLKENDYMEINLFGIYLRVPVSYPQVQDQKPLGYGMRDILIEYLANQEQLNRTLDHRIR